MKKVRITESQLRGLVKRMIRENVEKETSSIATIVKYYNQSNNNKLKQKISNYGNSRLPENPNPKQLYDFLNQIGDKNKLEMIKKMLEKDIQNKSITESQLRGIVKRMIRENIETKYAALAKKGFNPQEIQNIKNNFSAVQILNKMDLNREIINSDKPTIHTMLLQPDKVQMGMTTIGESQLRGLVKRMIREEYANNFQSVRQQLSNYRNASTSLRFNLGNTVVLPQNVDIRAIAYQNDSNLWNIYPDDTLRQQKVDFAFFVATKDGYLICYNPNRNSAVNSAIQDEQEFLSIFNQMFKTNCTKLSTKIV